MSSLPSTPIIMKRSYIVKEQITIPETGTTYEAGSTHDFTDEEVAALRYRFHAQIVPARQTAQGHPSAVRATEKKEEKPEKESEKSQPLAEEKEPEKKEEKPKAKPAKAESDSK